MKHMDRKHRVWHSFLILPTIVVGSLFFQGCNEEELQTVLNGAIDLAREIDQQNSDISFGNWLEDELGDL